MKKVGIITITGLGNYGNRLQNYALQKTIEKISSCRCETLINQSYRIKGYIKKFLIPNSEVLSERERIFEKFNKEFIHFSDSPNAPYNMFINNFRRLSYELYHTGHCP